MTRPEQARCAGPGGQNGWCGQPRPCPKHDVTGHDEAASTAVGDRVVIDFLEAAADYNCWKGRTGTVENVVPDHGLSHYVRFDQPYGRNGHHQTGAWFPDKAVHHVSSKKEKVMGVHPAIDREAWPAQGVMLHQPVRVCFHYNAAVLVDGVIVRDDAADPWRMIIRLEDGRFVLADECMWQPRDAPRVRTPRTPRTPVCQIPGCGCTGEAHA